MILIKMSITMKKIAKAVEILLLAALLTGCAADTTPPVTEEDAAVLATNELYAGREIVPSVPEGIYVTGEQPMSVSFEYEPNEEKERVLRYTLTSSSPDASSKICADGTLDLDYTATGDGASYQSIVRCALFEGSERVSEIYTFVYMNAAEDRFYMPVISIVSDRSNFYSSSSGILVEGDLRAEVRKNGNPKGWQPWYDNANYYGRGMEWERPVALTVFDELGGLGLSQNCGVRVSGGYTRVNTQKSLRLYARRDYSPDTGVFPYSFWSGARGSTTGTPSSFSDTVLLRGGSNNEGNAIFNTPCLLMLLEGTALDSPEITTIVEYINGKYLGVVTQLEDYDEDYFLVNYGVEKENLTTMKGTVGELLVPAGWHVDDGPEEEEDEFYDMLKYIAKNDMTDPECYAKACEMIDIQNFIEYMAFEGYIGNTDWPDNNLRAWRYNAGGYNPDGEGVFDGRWRFLTKDLDLSFSYGGQNANSNPYGYLRGNSGLLLKNVYTSLMKNDEFAELFYNFMCTLCEAVMTPERCEDVFDLMQVYTGKEVAYSISTLGVGGGSRTNWNNGFTSLRNFANTRAGVVLKLTRSTSKLELGDVSVSCNEGGTVELGWFEAQSGETRQYLIDTRIPLEIYPDDGYEIDEITYSGCEMSEDGYLVTSSGSAEVKVTFKAVGREKSTGIVINEVMFRGSDYEWIELYNCGDEDVLLSGWSLGKSEKNKKAKVFADTVIPSKGYALICVTDSANSAGFIGLSVQLPLGNGDTLYLFDSEGELVDSALMQSPSKTVHIGRYPDGEQMTQLSLAEATPGKANEIEEYRGAFGSETFVPYFLAWGRVYSLDDYFYEKDGELYARRDKLIELLSSDNRGAVLARHLKEEEGDIPLDELEAESRELSGATVRYVPELDSVIIT